MDEAITRWVNAGAGSHPILDAGAIAATQFGVPLLVLCVAIQWWRKSDRLHVRHTCVAAGISFLIGLGLNQLLLLFLHRVRPYDAGVSHLIIPPSSDWSFPSDHATAAFTIAATFALHGLLQHAAVFMLAALIIGWSRIFVGTHYLTDVLGGALTGIGVALLVRVAYREGSRVDRLVTGIF
jgi:undecaprenyl-diphosphatase